MGFCCLVAKVETMNVAIGADEEWLVTQKSGFQDMTIQIERGNGRHQSFSKISRPFQAMMIVWFISITRMLSRCG